MKENQFETIKQLDDQGAEYWSSRDFAKVLEYSDYRNFQTVIGKARIACENSGEVIHNHFVEASDMVVIGSGAEKSIETVYLSRYTCYLIVQTPTRQKLSLLKGRRILPFKPIAKKLLIIWSRTTNVSFCVKRLKSMIHH